MTTTEAYLRGKRRSGASTQRNSGGTGRRETVEADEEGEEEVDDEAE